MMQWICCFGDIAADLQEVLPDGRGGAGSVISSKKWDFLKISSGWHGARIEVLAFRRELGCLMLFK